ncbi:hypothetical protein [Kitasatospora cineracea]|uniref:hypothetical protein n=1 Tax=Kitasatospora cineracea TaxID=88074 RepID=UPI0033CA1FE4
MSNDVEDRRPPEQIARALRKPLTSDFELLAAKVIKKYTGAHVIIQDDGSRPAMPDILIEYPDGRSGVAEVWQDLDGKAAAVTQHMAKKGWVFPADSLGRVWFLELSGSFQVKGAEERVTDLLTALAAEGRTFEYVGHKEFLQNDPHPLVQKALEMGIVSLSSRLPRDGERLVIHLTPEGIYGQVDLPWEPFLDWIRDELSADTAHMRGNRGKLAQSGLDEHHAFLGITYSSPWAVFQALTWDSTSLPPQPPELPAEITHLWLMNADAPDRCLAWFPDRGWVEPGNPIATQ